jgi:hypothetical protein
MPQRPTEDLAVLLLRRATMAGGAELQLAGEVGLYVTDKKLGHRRMIAMIAVREPAGR